MNAAASTTSPKTLAYLPSIYEPTLVGATGADALQPATLSLTQDGHLASDTLRGLLQVIDSGFADIQRLVDDLDLYFDPYTAPNKPIQRRSELARRTMWWDDSNESDPDFLRWLGTWVNVDVDEVDTLDGNDEKLDQRRRALVAQAAELYERRGTKDGLQALLKAFFDIDVEIHEWAAPDGMRIGVSSTIGVDSVLMPDVPLQRSFVVVWKAPAELRDGLSAWTVAARRPLGATPATIGATIIRTQMEINRREPTESPPPVYATRWWDGTQWVPDPSSVEGSGASAPPAGRWDQQTQRWIDAPGGGNWIDDPKWIESASLRTKVERVSRAIERERPAHTHSYLALAWDESKAHEPFNVEITSTIGLTVVEPMG